MPVNATIAESSSGVPGSKPHRRPPAGRGLREWEGDHAPQMLDWAKVRLIPLGLTCPVAWRCLMRPVSLHPSSFALPLWLRPRSSGHRHMPPQSRLRPAPRSRRKISRRAMEEEGGASFNLACVSRRRKRAIDNVGDRALAQALGHAEIRVGVQRSCQPRM